MDEILKALRLGYNTVRTYADGTKVYTNSKTGATLKISPNCIIGKIGDVQGNPIQNNVQDLNINEKWFVQNNEGFYVSNKGNTEYTPDYITFTDKNTKSKLFETYTDLGVLTENGMTKIIPAIIKVKSVNDKVVIVQFADNTEEKAVLADGDTFSLEQGISICLTKKMLSELTGGNGSSTYNKLIDFAVHKYEDMRDFEKREAERKQQEKEAKRTLEGKRDKKRAKRKEKEIAEYTDILAQAISKAIQSCPNLIKDNSVSKDKK